MLNLVEGWVTGQVRSHISFTINWIFLLSLSDPGVCFLTLALAEVCALSALLVYSDFCFHLSPVCTVYFTSDCFHIHTHAKKKSGLLTVLLRELYKYAIQATHTLEMSHSVPRWGTSLNHLLSTAKPEFATAHHSKEHLCQQLSPARVSCVRHLIYTTFKWQHNSQISTSKTTK